MIKRIKYILILILCGQITYSQAFTESALLDYKRSIVYITNLHDTVESSQWYYTFVKDSIPFAVAKDSLTQTRARNNIMLQNRAILGGPMYRKFDTIGRLVEYVNVDIDRSYFGKSEPNYKTGSIYTYDDQDWKDKNEIKIKKRQIYPVYDDNILVKLNQDVKYDGSSNLLYYNYDYILDENGKIVKEINYSNYLPFTESEYIYDERNNIKQINIRSKQETERPIPFHFLGTEVNFCPDLHVSYEYDNNDRITQVTYYGCRDTLAFEKYTYHPEKEYITERIRYIKSDLRLVEHRTRTMIFYHNENGDIIEKRYVKDRPNQTLVYDRIFLPESIYYTYEYDEYKNWVKCYIYMEGKPEESDPTAIAQRDIEYYDS